MGAIINIFKSIIGLITGIFSKKQAAPAVAGQPAPTKQVKAKRSKDGFYMEASAAPSAPAAAPSAVSAKPAAVQPTAAKPAAADTAPAKKGGVPKQSTKGKVGQAAAAAAVAAVATVTAAPQPVDAVDLIRAALAATQSNPGEVAAQAEATASFAEMNAVPLSTGGRRRPGANMAGFLDMAKMARKR
jgi:hypothetical protein